MEFANKSKWSFTENYNDISQNYPKFLTIQHWYSTINGISGNEAEI